MIINIITNILYTNWVLFGVNMNIIGILLYIFMFLGLLVFGLKILDSYKHNETFRSWLIEIKSFYKKSKKPKKH